LIENGEKNITHWSRDKAFKAILLDNTKPRKNKFKILLETPQNLEKDTPKHRHLLKISEMLFYLEPTPLRKILEIILLIINPRPLRDYPRFNLARLARGQEND
jgi:hypothetical protein